MKLVLKYVLEIIEYIDVVNAYTQLCELLSIEVFNGENVEVHLCDGYFEIAM
ncbi:hypothetical protein [Oceanirhabdus sp. W0125-5]|uniref:hypothetical protein n=1 Tax=Oceanirhabdus sp. W0125-5 TaxID=2999116 RepID=UPI0022F31C87|nr:hypothetical protein [Oceanirhabdus sp. W0125-5]WBW97087.1 hypothetical protein OW730_25865 [Oceanirhabdus sp. W0125-5]